MSEIKKSAKYDNFVIVQHKKAGNSAENSISIVCRNTKEGLRRIAPQIGMAFDNAWTTNQFGKRLIDFINGDASKGQRSAKYENFVITQDKNQSISITCSNTKKALRQIAEEIGMAVDVGWNTQQFGNKLIDFINEGNIVKAAVQNNVSEENDFDEADDEAFKKQLLDTILNSESADNESDSDEDEPRISDEDWQWWCDLSDASKYILLDNIKWDIEDTYGEFSFEDGKLITAFDVNDRKLFSKTVALNFTGYAGNTEGGDIISLFAPRNNVEAKDIGRLSRLKQVYKFSMANCGAEVLMDGVSELTQLKVLSLYGNEFNENELLKLASLNNLEELNLSRNQLSSNNLEAYSVLTKFSNLRDLTIEYNQVELPAELFSYLSQLSHLEVLILIGSDFTSEKLEDYAALANLTQLKVLDISACGKLPPEILTYICQLPNLEELHIEARNISNAQAISALSNLKNINIRRGISYSSEEDTDLSDIFAVLASMNNLEQITLSSIKGLNTEHVPLLNQLSNLKALEIDCSDISADKIIHFTTLTNLDTLTLHSFEFDDECKEWSTLQEKLPNCRISRW